VQRRGAAHGQVEEEHAPHQREDDYGHVDAGEVVDVYGVSIGIDAGFGEGASQTGHKCVSLGFTILVYPEKGSRRLKNATF